MSWLFQRPCKDISNEILLITGASRGIGRLMAVEFAKHSPKMIILWGRNTNYLQATCKAVRAHGVLCHYMECDIRDRERVYEVAKEIQENIGGVSMLVNNAGIVCGKPLTDAEPEEIEDVIATNLTAHFWILKAFLPNMIEHNHGHIITINSVIGQMGLAGAIPYSASKHGALGLAESLEQEILNSDTRNIHFTNIHPYLVATPMFYGCQTRFPWLFPALDPETVAQNIVTATLRNQRQVLMPKLMYYAVVFKNLLPVSAWLAASRFLGMDTAMDKFHARVAIEDVIETFD